MSFRFKLIIGVVVIQGLLLAVLAWNSLSSLRKSNEEEFLKRATITAALFASSTQAAVLSTDLGFLDSAVREIIKNTGVVYARIYAGKKILSESGDPKVLAREFVPDLSLDTVQDGVFDISSKIDIAGQEYGKIELGFAVDKITGLLVKTRDRRSEEHTSELQSR